MNLQGEVFSGEGEASRFLKLRPYRDFLRRWIGRPFPGTLNLRVDGKKLEDLKKEAAFHRLEGFKYRGDDFGGLNLYMVKINDKVAGVIEPDRSRYGSDVAEVVADEELRKIFNLEDGDTVRIKPFKG
ncbi:MAG: DUF120 domain-containing protein [Candidatus Nanohaloarchaea archaeon]